MTEDKKTKVDDKINTIFKSLEGNKITDNYTDYVLAFLFLKIISKKQEQFAQKIINKENGAIYENLEDGKLLNKIEKASHEKLGYFIRPGMLYRDILEEGELTAEGYEPTLGLAISAINLIYGDRADSYYICISELIESFGKSRLLPRHIHAGFIVKVMNHLNQSGIVHNGDDKYKLSDTFERVIDRVANTNKRNDFHTSYTISELIAQLIASSHKKVNSIYDPACGSGALLLKVSQATSCEKVIGQDISQKNIYLSRMNLLVHDYHPLNFDIQAGDAIADPKHLGVNFDVIVSCPPFGLQKRQINALADIRFKPYSDLLPKKAADFLFIIHMLHHLSPTGTLMTVVPQGLLFRGGIEQKLRKRLIEENFIDAVISLPANLHHHTGIQTSILVLRKNRDKDEGILFVDGSGEDHYMTIKNKNRLRQSDIDLIVDSYKNKAANPHFSRLVSRNDVLKNDANLNPSRYEDSSNAAKAIRWLAEQYGSFDYVRLSDLVKSIRIIGKDHKLSTDENLIYFPRKTVLKVRSKETIKSIKTLSNYFEIKLDEQSVISDYMAYFFESELGQNIIKTQSIGMGIPSISKDDLLSNIKVPLPSLLIQKKVVSAYQLMNRVISSIENIQKDLSLSPNTAHSVTEKLQGTLESLNELSEEESILAEIRKGESKTMEFKESFSLDVRQFENNKKYTPKKEGKIELSSLKNVVGFINSEGGKLLIGVEDGGKITGLEKELELFHKNSEDNFLLHFKNLTKKSIGPNFYSHFNANIKTVNNKKIMVVECVKSENEPCYLDDDFYVRTNPATDKLTTKEAHKYISEHFKPH